MHTCSTVYVDRVSLAYHKALLLENKCIRIIECKVILTRKSRAEPNGSCDRKARAASAQSFALWQQTTIEITCHDHSGIACSRHIYYIWVSSFVHIPFVVNRTFNATPTEKMQHDCRPNCPYRRSNNNYGKKFNLALRCVMRE